MIVSTGTSVCTCPLGYAGRFCNIGKPLSFPSFMRQPWGMVSGGPCCVLASWQPLCLQFPQSAAFWEMVQSIVVWPAPLPQV